MTTDPKYYAMSDKLRQRPRAAFSLSRAAHAALEDLVRTTGLPRARVVEALLLAPIAQRIVENYAEIEGPRKSTGA